MIWLDLLLSLPAVEPEPEEPNYDFLGIVIPSVASGIVGIIGAISIIWRRRQDRADALADKQTDAENAQVPKVVDGWDEVRRARAEATTYYNLYRFFETAFYTARNALRKVVQWVRDEHPEHEFDKDVVDALAIKPPDAVDASK